MIASSTKLTPDILNRVTLLIRNGNTDEIAAKGAGISPATFYRWMDAGRVIAAELERLPRMTRAELLEVIRNRKLDVKIGRSRVPTIRKAVREQLKLEDGFYNFAVAVDDARVACETDLVAQIQKASGKSYRAALALLERRFPERWAKLSAADLRDRYLADRAPEAPGGNADDDGDEETAGRPQNPAAQIRDELAQRRAARTVGPN